MVPRSAIVKHVLKEGEFWCSKYFAKTRSMTKFNKNAYQRNVFSCLNFAILKNFESYHRQIESEEEKERTDLVKIWQELRHVVRCVYREAGTGLTSSKLSEPLPNEDSIGLLDAKKMKELVHR